MDYQQKYLKYKAKYLALRQSGGLGGHLQVYFLTEEQQKAITSSDEYNHTHPGLKFNKKTKNSGISEKYSHVTQHHNYLYKIVDGKKEKIDLGKGLKFNYKNPTDVESVKKKLTNAKYILLIRDYSALDDVYAGMFKITENNTIECMNL